MSEKLCAKCAEIAAGVVESKIVAGNVCEAITSAIRRAGQEQNTAGQANRDSKSQGTLTGTPVPAVPAAPGMPPQPRIAHDDPAAAYWWKDAYYALRAWAEQNTAGQEKADGKVEGDHKSAPDPAVPAAPERRKGNRRLVYNKATRTIDEVSPAVPAAPEGMPEEPYQHCPAAFINAIAEEGTKAEAVEWLQKTWDECCALRAALLREKAATTTAHEHRQFAEYERNQALARAKAAEEDAGRYRWLRESDDRDWNALFRDGGENLDAAIDAARSKP